MAGILVAQRTAPADIGAAREALYGPFQLWLWSRGCGTMAEIETELREGRLTKVFQVWLRSRVRKPGATCLPEKFQANLQHVIAKALV